MDFLNKAAAQITDLFRSMTPGARILASLLLAVIVVSLVFLFRYEVSGGNEYLYNAAVFSNDDLLEIEKIFSKDSRLTDYDIIGGRVRIDRNRRGLYLAALADAGFTPDNPTGVLEKAYQNIGVWDRGDIAAQRISTAEDKRLAMIISGMSGIQRATVKIHEFKTGAFDRKIMTSALVTVKATGDRSLTEAQVKSIRQAIAAAHAALAPEEIAVLDENRGYTWGGGIDGRLPSDDPYIANKNKYEEDWRHKLESMLDWVDGVRVAVDVELEPEMDVQLVKITRDPRAINTHQKTSAVETSNRSQNPKARPGAVSNGVGNQSVSITDGPVEEATRTEQTEELNSLTTAHEQVTSTRPSLMPKRVKASISVPVTYLVNRWKIENPPAEGEEPTEPKRSDLLAIEDNVRNTIEESVVTLLPEKPPGVDKYQPVRVTFFDDLPPVHVPPPTFTDTAGSWFAANWETLGLVFVGLFSLFMLRGMVRAPQDAEPDADVPALQLAGADLDEESPARDGDEEDDEEEERHGFKSTGPNLREELSSLVHDDPDAAANVLRNWIGDAA